MPASVRLFTCRTIDLLTTITRTHITCVEDERLDSEAVKWWEEVEVTILGLLGARSLQHLPEVGIRFELPLRRQKVIIVHGFSFCVSGSLCRATSLSRQLSNALKVIGMRATPL